MKENGCAPALILTGIVWVAIFLTAAYVVSRLAQ